jgi:hypothetical protein
VGAKAPEAAGAIHSSGGSGLWQICRSGGLESGQAKGLVAVGGQGLHSERRRHNGYPSRLILQNF